MWGRIANIASKMDDSFGAHDGRGDVAGSDSSNSVALPAIEDDNNDNDNGNDVVDEDDDDNDNGWGDDDFGEDLDLDLGDEPAENRVNGGAESLEGEASFVNNNKVDGAANGAPLGGQRQQTLLEEEASLLNDNVALDAGVSGLAAKAEGINLVVESVKDDHPPITAMEEIEVEEDVENAFEETNPEIEESHPPQLPQSAPPIYDRPDAITVSAPGKALIAGGYLVLESPNPGVVLATDGCRFHATVAFRPPHSDGGGVVGNIVDASWGSIPLDVHSPQFDRVFSYYLSYSMGKSGGEDEVALRLQPRTGRREPNAFVERSLLLALGYLRQFMGAGAFHARLREHGGLNGSGRVALAIKLRADNDFYSQIARLRERGWDLTPGNLEKLEPFLPCPRDEKGELVVNKTGMGSSAALVTSLVGALLRFFGVVYLPCDSGEGGEGSEAEGKTNGVGVREEEGLKTAHNLAQICHCHAQGKVGSGFDISSAVYGSHVYTRFSRGVISDYLESLPAMAEGENEGLQLSESSLEQLVALVNDIDWDCTVHPVDLPRGLELVMADVCGGSESPSMARKVLDWKKNRRKTGFMDDYYWKDLKRCNNKIVSLLSGQLTEQTFLDGLRRDGAAIVSARTAEQWKKPMPSSWHKFEGSSWDVALKLLDLRMTFLECRQNLKGMGESAGVPIEPDGQSALADATMMLPGVVAAGVPGAGGYDALYAIYVKGPETSGGSSDYVRDEICNLWRKMSEENKETTVCPLSVRAARSAHGLCSTKLDW